MVVKFNFKMRYLYTIIFLFFTSNGFCQVLTNNGSVVNISTGTVISTASLENLNGTISNSGTLIIRTDFHNQAGITGNGTYNIAGNWNDNGTFTAGSGIVIFNGTTAQDVYSANSFNNLSINKSAGAANLSSDITVNGVLNFISGKIQTGANDLIIPATGSITGAAQNTGWVYGNLQKNISTGSPSAIFAIGGNTYYTSVTVAFNNVTSGGNLTIKTTGSDHPNLSSSGLDVNKSVNRYFTISNNSIVFTDAAVTLNWVAPDIDAGASTANFVAAIYNGASWTFPTIASPNATSIQIIGITAFRDFAVGEMFSALPVKLTNLRGYTKNHGIQVDWITQSESNMDRYEIEKSANGQQFAKAGTVKAKGNSSIIVNYGWFDANPFNAINYYRIRSVETTGQVSYSPVVKVNISTGRSEIIFYPNPVIGNTIKLQLNNITRGNYTVILTNTLGQQVFKKLILHNGGSALQGITVNNLPKGIYLLHVTGGGINFTKQVIKN